jgi:uncharacterized membrane protein YhaH (DUF805 family)
MEWYLKVLKNYVGFSGRARRKEYWMFFLVNLIVSIALSIIEWVIGLPTVLTGLYSLAIFLPSLAVTIRRLHDTNRSGWWVLISLVPFIGVIVLLVFTVLDSDPHENNYGPNPKFDY